MSDLKTVFSGIQDKNVIYLILAQAIFTTIVYTNVEFIIIFLSRNSINNVQLVLFDIAGCTGLVLANIAIGFSLRFFSFKSIFTAVTILMPLLYLVLWFFAKTITLLFIPIGLLFYLFEEIGRASCR